MSISDSELEEDEEEILVYVEFDSCTTNDVFSSENLKLDMLGLDSDHPVMQVNGKFFEGTYEDAVGTYLFFDKDEKPQIDDQVFDKVPTMKYFSKTRKLLRMQRAFVVPRYEVIGDSEHSKCIPNVETLEEAGIPPRYQNEAMEFWKDARDKRVAALHEYLKKQEFRKELRKRGFEPESDSEEDNPFAMYKYLENEAEMSRFAQNEEENVDFQSKIEDLENSLQNTELGKQDEAEVPKKLTVIDPGPSTSKSSMPWVDENTSDKQSAVQKVKSVGRVREKTMKGKIQKKAVKKKRLPLSQDKLDENSTDASVETSVLSESKELNENCISENGEKKEKELDDGAKQIEKPKRVGKQIFKNDEMEVDEEAVNESAKLLCEELNMSSSYTTEKNKRKQERREAKMKEISEKLKSLGQTSSQPNS